TRLAFPTAGGRRRAARATRRRGSARARRPPRSGRAPRARARRRGPSRLRPRPRRRPGSQCCDTDRYFGRAQEASARLALPFALGVALHPLEALVVVGELLHVRERDLPRDDRVVVGDVRLWIVASVLELDVHALPELLELEPGPVDSDLVSDTARLLDRCSTGLRHPSGTSYDSAGGGRRP